MKKILKRFGIILLALIVVIFTTVFILFYHEIATLASLKKINDYPFYNMTYSGDYGFNDFLEVGASSDKDIEKFVVKRLLKGIDIDLNISSAGCSAFATHNETGESILARNFDFPYSPSLLLYTKPDDGYESVSIVNLSYAGYGKDNLPEPYKMNSFLTLAAPYLPFDGMNECGVSMALLAVPYAQPPKDEGKISLNTTTAIRLVLDKASNVDEAIELLKQYNYYFSGDVDCHYILADASGRSVIIEFIDNEIKVIETDKDYQVVTNYIIYDGINKGDGFDRFNIANEHLDKVNGVMSEEDAMELLERVKIPNSTQWSVVYNMVSKKFTVCIDEEYDTSYEYELD